MSTYDKLLDVVSEYIIKDEVQDTDEVISAYTLWEAIKSEYHKVRYVKNDNCELLDFINYIYKDMFYHDPDLYYCALENFGIKASMFKPIQFSELSSRVMSDDTVCITLYPAGKRNEDKYISIYRDLDDTIYYGNHINDVLVRNTKDGLDNIFDTIVAFYEESKDDCNYTQNISNDTIDISMRYDIYADLKLDIRLNDVIDPKKSQYKNYYSKLYPIYRLISDKQETFLKTTPVNISDLNNFCRAVVKKYKEENTKATQKKLEFGLINKEVEKK